MKRMTSVHTLHFGIETHNGAYASVLPVIIDADCEIYAIKIGLFFLEVSSIYLELKKTDYKFIVNLLYVAFLWLLKYIHLRGDNS